MLLTPTLLALLCCSALACAVAAVAAASGLSAAAGWDPESSSPRQLARERRALLVEAALKVVLSLQVAALLLYVVTLDRLHPLFAGAMCAAGTLNASRFGYPALGVKVGVALFCGVWLLVNRASAGAAATAVVFSKHALAVVAAGALVVENVLQYRFFSDLDPQIVTSCCATTFGTESGGIASGIAALPAGASRTTFFAVLVLTLATGLYSRHRRRALALYAALALALGAVSAAAVVTWVAPAYYQLPRHHCPFCLLSRELGFVGYPLYFFLAAAVVTGVASGLVHRLRRSDPLRSIQPAEEAALSRISMIGFGLFSLLAVWPYLASVLRLPSWG